MKAGNIIFLNGASSSGRTTIAEIMQDTLEEPYLYISVENFFELLPKRFEEGASRELMEQLASGMHHCVAALSKSGNNVIVDHILAERSWLKECADLLFELPVTFVGVRCPVAELERREAKHGDRQPGVARYQYEHIHYYSIYDVEVDTSIARPAECAALIIAAQKRAITPNAFARNKERLAADNI